MLRHEAQGERMLGGIGSLKACTAEHHIEIMDADVVPDALPKQFDHWTDAKRLEHAGAAELKKVQAAFAGNERRDVEFALGIEAAMTVGDILAQKPVSSDKLAIFDLDCLGGGGLALRHDEQMIANRIEGIAVEAARSRRLIGRRGKF